MGRRAGKTTGLCRAAGQVTLNGGQVFWGAPTYDLAFIGRERFQKLYRPVILSSENERPRDNLVGRGAVYWRSFDRPGSALGRGFHLAAIEEAARVKGKQVYEELLATIADTDGKLVAITTPRGQRHWTYDWWQRAQDGDPLYRVIHGPSTANPMPSVQRFVQMAKANMPEYLFRQEIMAEFLAGEGGVFRNIQDCCTVPGYLGAPPDGVRRYVIGADVARHRDWTVLVALDVGTGEVHGLERFQHVPWPLVEERLVRFWNIWNRGEVFLDSTGVGDVLYDYLVSRQVRVQPVRWDSEVKANLVMNLSVALEYGRIRFPPDPILTGELEAFEYDMTPTGRFRYNAPEGQHDDCVAAVAMAQWGRSHRGPGDKWLEWMRDQMKPAA